MPVATRFRVHLGVPRRLFSTDSKDYQVHEICLCMFYIDSGVVLMSHHAFLYFLCMFCVFYCVCLHVRAVPTLGCGHFFFFLPLGGGYTNSWFLWSAGISFHSGGSNWCGHLFPMFEGKLLPSDGDLTQMCPGGISMRINKNGFCVQRLLLPASFGFGERRVVLRPCFRVPPCRDVREHLVDCRALTSREPRMSGKTRLRSRSKSFMDGASSKQWRCVNVE